MTSVLIGRRQAAAPVKPSIGQFPGCRRHSDRLLDLVGTIFSPLDFDVWVSLLKIVDHHLPGLSRDSPEGNRDVSGWNRWFSVLSKSRPGKAGEACSYSGG